MEGFLLIDKPAGLTSHDAVNRIRELTGEQRVGHAGTLDPFATGLLIVGVGRNATKLLGDLTTGTMKTYEAVLRLGATSETDDPEGPIFEREESTPLRKADILPVIRQFQGKHQQTPPALSAVKVGGVPAFRRVRRGEAVQLEPRSVEIHSLSVMKYAWPELRIEVTCGAGTYIRVLARDIGEGLGCGAYLIGLRRTAIGSWSIRQAVPLVDLTSEQLAKTLLPVALFQRRVD
jgi:tRNA pseudouridine55 synthase